MRPNENHYEKEKTDIKQVSGNSTCDQMNYYKVIEQQGTTAAISPRKNAKVRRRGNRKAPPHPRDYNLSLIRRYGRKARKKSVGYHRRPIAEATTFRYKAVHFNQKKIIRLGIKHKCFCAGRENDDLLKSLIG